MVETVDIRVRLLEARNRLLMLYYASLDERLEEALKHVEKALEILS